jgi:hypothetical protein
MSTSHQAMDTCAHLHIIQVPEGMCSSGWWSCTPQPHHLTEQHGSQALHPNMQALPAPDPYAACADCFCCRCRWGCSYQPPHPLSPRLASTLSVLG